MLKEEDIIEAVCTELRRRGYAIEQKLTTKQQGDDVIAVKLGHPKQPLFVEAKGETSSRIGSKRYGKPFDSAQVRVHVAEALYKAAEVLSRTGSTNDARVGIAFPDNDLHRRLEKVVHAVIIKLGIAVFWVRQDKSVEVQSPWEV